MIPLSTFLCQLKTSLISKCSQRSTTSDNSINGPTNRLYFIFLYFYSPSTLEKQSPVCGCLCLE
ncbi:hypothetical protein BCR41DRAFT_363772 [Lobosporangium transversale]|uniref:Uncharacterized protein n=1 Tax=Lobosporangium transversale TaxID=64571 RepID=A0A1Y2GB79_9FUNG|nr:hypothetical protein BCR41DRAFT_363772 [Lobosporangium transversale]ORY99671.1 hypothetical protein BCR41DRAFT_363772 [Lobosporangium transversale]|eukprot:XP_021875935.1 hypothetical protein BCR41DRAFT_363772 [Lobosporangium transversale]